MYRKEEIEVKIDKAQLHQLDYLCNEVYGYEMSHMAFYRAGDYDIGGEKFRYNFIDMFENLLQVASILIDYVDPHTFERLVVEPTTVDKKKLERELNKLRSK